MAQIYLRGFQEPINLTKARAIQVKKDWDEGNLPDIVNLGEISIKRVEIKSIVLDSSEENSLVKQSQEFQEQWQNMKDVRLGESQNTPANKSRNNLSVFRLFLEGSGWASKFSELESVFIQKAEEFFTANNKRSLVDAELIMDIIKSIPGWDNVQIDQYQQHSLEAATRTLVVDKKEANYR